MLNSTSTSDRSWAILPMIVACGLVWRLGLLSESLWIDELHTAWAVSGGWHELVERAQLGNNSPLYFRLVYLLTRFLGTHEWTLRAISVVAGLGLIVATYGVARALKCPAPAALLAAALVAIDANAVYFSTEARTYGLLQLVAAGRLFCFCRLLSGDRHGWTWLCWVLSGIALFHLHCTTALILVAELCAYWWLIALRRELQLHPVYLLIGFAMVLLSMLPAAELLQQVVARRENWELFISKQSPLATLTIFPLHTYLLVPLAASAVAIASSRLWLTDEPNSGSQAPAQSHFVVPLVVCLNWILVPVIAAWCLTEFDIARLFFRRYVIASGVALAPLSALLISWLVPRPKFAWFASTIVVFVALGTIVSLAPRGENWRDAIAVINGDQDGLPVILYSGLIESDQWHEASDRSKREYCEFPLRGLYPLDLKREVISLPKTGPFTLSAHQRQRIANGAWLLIRGANHAPRVIDDIRSSLSDEFVLGDRLNFDRMVLQKVLRREESD